MQSGLFAVARAFRFDVVHRLAVSSSQFLPIDQLRIFCLVDSILRVACEIIHDTSHLTVHQGCDLCFKNPFNMLVILVSRIRHHDDLGSSTRESTIVLRW